MPKKIVPTLAGRTIRCILFDLGETLWTHVDKATWQSLKQFANQRALHVLQQYLAAERLLKTDLTLSGKQLRAAIETQTHLVDQQTSGYEPDFALATIEALAQLGFPRLDRAVGEAIFEALRMPILGSRVLFDDVLSTLASLQQRGFLLGVVTNRHWGGQPFMEDLRTLGLLDYFDPRSVAISADLKARKPNPAIFLHTLDALNVAPQEAAMVGDSLRSDIAGALALDIFAIWKPKMHLRAKVQAELMTQETAKSNRERSKDQPISAIEAASAINGQELEHRDDEYLLAYVQQEEAKRDHLLDRNLRPDLIITHVSDLLDVLIEAGKQ